MKKNLKMTAVTNEYILRG